MRFFLVISIWIVIVGGLWGYISQRDYKRQQIVASSPVDLSVQGDFSVEITPTFSTEEDPFALTVSDSTVAPFEIKLNGTSLETEIVDLQRGQKLRLEKISGMLAGHNEFFITASPPLSEDNLEHGIRIKLFEDQTLIVDKTVWSGLGSQVSGTVSFTHMKQQEDDHDH